MAIPSIATVEFDDATLRRGRPNSVVDKDGYPIMSRGFLTGSGISPGDFNRVYTFKFRLHITSPDNKREWKGRLVAPVYNNNGGFLKWEFVVVCTKNEADPGSETETINITVTNPDGQSPAAQATVNSSEVP